MIVFGSFHAIAPLINNDNSILFNINAPVDRGNSLPNILLSNIPQGTYLGEYEYDLMYADYLTKNDAAFSDLMNIIYNDYIGNNVYVIIDKAWWSMLYIESLIKFIQVRYGFTPNLINEPDDIFSCKQTEYSIEGRQQLQVDKERFIYLHYDYFMDMEDKSDDWCFI